MSDLAPLVRSELTYRVQVKQSVEATLETVVTVHRSAVAAWLECDPADVTPRDIEAYVTEFEHDDGSPLIDEGDYELSSVDSWDYAEVEVLSEKRESIAPPAFVPLFDLEES